MRGADKQGNVANFNETEQIIEYGEYRCSFVQVRLNKLISVRLSKVLSNTL